MTGYAKHGQQHPGRGESGGSLLLLLDLRFPSQFSGKQLKDSLMKKIFSRIIPMAIIAIFTTTPSTSHAEKFMITYEQLDIYNTVSAEDGYITKELHDEFWSMMPEEEMNDPEKRKIIISSLETTLLLRERLQKELWNSIKASMAKKKVVQTPDYKQVQSAFLASVTDPAAKRDMEQRMAFNDAMIKAAATGVPIETPKGPISITPGLLAKALPGLDASLVRTQLLVSPDWSPPMLKILYPRAHVAITSIIPFRTRQKVDIGSADHLATSVILENTVSEDRTLTVSYTNEGQPMKNPEAMTAQILTSVSEENGFSLLAPIAKERWRGLHSAKGIFKITSHDTTSFMSLRLVDLPHHTGYMYLTAESGLSTDDASQMLKSLEESLQFID